MPKRARTKEELIQIVIATRNKKIFYKSKEWKLTRHDVIDRDKDCQRCRGAWNDPRYPIERLKVSPIEEVHHIKPLLLYPHLGFELKNLVGLCKDCHNIVEGRSIETINKNKKKEPLTEERW